MLYARTILLAILGSLGAPAEGPTILTFDAVETGKPMPSYTDRGVVFSLPRAPAKSRAGGRPGGDPVAATGRERPIPRRHGGHGAPPRQPGPGGADRRAIRLPHRRERVQAHVPPPAAGRVPLRRGGQARRLRPAAPHE